MNGHDDVARALRLAEADIGGVKAVSKSASVLQEQQLDDACATPCSTPIIGAGWQKTWREKWLRQQQAEQRQQQEERQEEPARQESEQEGQENQAENKNEEDAGTFSRTCNNKSFKNPFLTNPFTRKGFVNLPKGESLPLGEIGKSSSRRTNEHTVQGSPAVSEHEWEEVMVMIEDDDDDDEEDEEEEEDGSEGEYEDIDALPSTTTDFVEEEEEEEEEGGRRERGEEEEEEEEHSCGSEDEGKNESCGDSEGIRAEENRVDVQTCDFDVPDDRDEADRVTEDATGRQDDCNRRGDDASVTVADTSGYCGANATTAVYTCDGEREYEVVLDKTKGLGLVLVDDDEVEEVEEEEREREEEEREREELTKYGTSTRHLRTLVFGFAPLADGSVGPAESCGKIACGDVLVAVNRRGVSALPYDTVVGYIADSHSDIRLTFRKEPIVSPASTPASSPAPLPVPLSAQAEVVSAPAPTPFSTPGISLKVPKLGNCPSILQTCTASTAAVTLYTATTHSTLQMEADERRIKHLLSCHKIAFEEVHLDLHPDQQNAIFNISKTTVLPQLFSSVSGYIGPFDAIQEMEDRGVLMKLLGKGLALDTSEVQSVKKHASSPCSKSPCSPAMPTSAREQLEQLASIISPQGVCYGPHSVDESPLSPDTDDEEYTRMVWGAKIPAQSNCGPRHGFLDQPELEAEPVLDSGLTASIVASEGGALI
jgi:hypothetical protein